MNKDTKNYLSIKEYQEQKDFYYYCFILGRDFLTEELKEIESDIAFEICVDIAKSFLNTKHFKDYSVSGYDALQNYIKDSYCYILQYIKKIKELKGV